MSGRATTTTALWQRLRRPATTRDLALRTWVRRAAIVVMLGVVLARPGYGRLEVPSQLSDVDVIVVVDRTRSMAALDYDGRQPRLLGAEQDLQELAAGLPGARFAMIAFGTEARQVLPLTTDASAFDAAVQTIDLEGPQEGDGSQAERPAAVLAETLARAKDADPGRRRVVVYVGDGEDTSPVGTGDQPAPADGFASLREEVSGGVVLGYGTTNGAVMPTDDPLAPGADSGNYVVDSSTGQSAVSRADLDNLREVADQLGVPFEHRTSPGGMDDVASGIGASFADGGLGGGQRAAHDLTWLAGLLLLALLLAELRPAWRAVWRSRDELAPAAQDHERPATQEVAR